VSVLVAGNAALDRTFVLERLPMPGETVLAGGCQRRPGGKGLNQAVTAARAGASVRLVAGVGSDQQAEEIARYLEGEPLEATLLRGGGATDESVVLVAADGENTIVSTAHQARLLPMHLVEAAIATAAPGGILLLQGNLSAEVTRRALEQGGDRQLQRIANAAPVAFPWQELQAHIDVLIVNAVEARLVGPLSAATVVITEGAAGATLIQGMQRRQVAAPAVAAIDTTGAGDVLCGMLTAALDRGMPVLEALERAVRAAALKVTRAGASSGLPAAAELREILG
jgi:ribokinase